jgi:hypothetical protein
MDNTWASPVDGANKRLLGDSVSRLVGSKALDDGAEGQALLWWRQEANTTRILPIFFLRDHPTPDNEHIHDMMHSAYLACMPSASCLSA